MEVGAVAVSEMTGTLARVREKRQQKDKSNLFFFLWNLFNIVLCDKEQHFTTAKASHLCVSALRNSALKTPHRAHDSSIRLLLYQGTSTAGHCKWVQSLFGPFAEGLDSMILVGAFQLRILCVILCNVSGL